MLQPIISSREVGSLKSHAIIDARGGGDAKERYLKSHIENALYVDLDQDLSQKPTNPAYGGRHPLPELSEFGKLLGRLGISPATHVLVYDDKGGANAAARFWWMMKSIGHEKIQVVNGGLEAMIKAGVKITSEIISPNTVSPYPVKQWSLPLVDINVVERASLTGDLKIVDVREAFRYRGESEPIDLIAGHIPGALNIPYVENLNADGSFRSPQELKEKYQEIVGDKPENVIVHCGSGVTACHTLLALEYAGINGANLYVGSWGEWSRREKPIGKG